MSEPIEDTKNASFWADAPMPTVRDRLPISSQEEAQDSEGGLLRPPQRRRRTSSKPNLLGEGDQVCHLETGWSGAYRIVPGECLSDGMSCSPGENAYAQERVLLPCDPSSYT